MRVSGNDHWTLCGGRVANMKVSRSRNSNADSRMFRNDDGMLHGGGVANLRASMSGYPVCESFPASSVQTLMNVCTSETPLST